MNQLLLFTVSILVSGCALFGGGSDDALPRAKGYDIQAASNWIALDHKQADSAYKLKSGSVVTLTSSCTRNAKVGLELLTRHLLMGSRNVSYKSQTKMTVNDTEGLYSSVRANYDGVPMNLELFVLPTQGCVFDFSMINNQTIGSSDVSEFQGFIKSFHYAR